MIFAKDKTGRRIRAKKGLSGYCPSCGAELKPKCGRIVTPHWAHDFGDCDSWSGPETEWHRYWKSLVPSDCVEVVIERNGVRHRADIVTKAGVVVELQHSHIGPDEIEKRERFYGRMIWLFDMSAARPEPICRRISEEEADVVMSLGGTVWEDALGPFVEDRSPGQRIWIKEKDGYHSFLWERPRKSIAFAKREVYLDVGRDEIFRIKKIYQKPSWRGWGYLNSRNLFEEWLKKACGA